LIAVTVMTTWVGIVDIAVPLAHTVAGGLEEIDRVLLALLELDLWAWLMLVCHLDL
jgi:hypothetical protein